MKQRKTEKKEVGGTEGCTGSHEPLRSHSHTYPCVREPYAPRTAEPAKLRVPPRSIWAGPVVLGMTFIFFFVFIFSFLCFSVLFFCFFFCFSVSFFSFFCSFLFFYFSVSFCLDRKSVV